MGKAVAFVGSVLVLGLSASAWAGPVGPAFNVSSCTGCLEQGPAVAGSPSGTFVTVWKGTSATHVTGVSGRFFSSAGTAVASDFLANKDQLPDQYDPAVASDKQGNFIVVWSEVLNGNSEIRARRYQANGTPLSDPFTVNQDATGTPTIPADFNPAVAGTKDGGFIVTWMNLLPSGNNFPGTTPQVLARKLDPTGTPVGNQVKISTGLVNGDRPHVCVDSNGGPVVVWTSVDGFPLFEDNHKGVSLRRLTAAGAPTGTAETVVAPPTAGSLQPAVGCGTGGAFVVVWHSDQAPATQQTDILAQRYSRLGRKVGPTFVVNTTLGMPQLDPAVTFDPKGNFTVVWQSYLPGSKVNIMGRRFNTNGGALTPEFTVFSGFDNALVPRNPDVASVGTAGNYVVVWQAGAQTIRGRRFTP